MTQQAASPNETTAPTRRESLSGTARRLGARVASLPPSMPGVVLVLVLAWFVGPNFFSPTNLIGLAPQIAALSVLTIGQTLVLLVRGLDLSVSAVVLVAGVVLSGAVFTSVPEQVAVVIGVGIAIGLLNGLLITKRRVPAFIATYGTLIFLGGLEVGVTQGETAGAAPDWMVTIGVGRLGFVPWSVIIALAVLALVALVLYRTRYGRWIYAIGSNPDAARYSGIKVDRVTIACYVACGLLAVVAGIMMGGFAEYVDNTLGTDANLNSIAAAIIGGIAFTGGRGRLSGAVAGAILLTMLLNLLTLSGFEVQWRYVMQGLVLIAAVALQRSRGRVTT